MALTDQDVDYFAELSRLELNAEEKERFRRQLSAILDYFHLLQTVITEKIEPTASVSVSESNLREDVSRPGLVLEDLLRNAPLKDRDQFRLPPVFD